MFLTCFSFLPVCYIIFTTIIANNYSEKHSVFLSRDLYMFISQCVVFSPNVALGKGIVDFDHLYNLKEHGDL